MRLLMPDLLLGNVYKISAKKLAEAGIRGILLDIDDTLASHKAPLPDERVGCWIKELLSDGIKIAVVSNNSTERVRRFISGLALGTELPFISCAAKPLPFSYIKARRMLGVGRNETAAVGDQLFTDSLGAHLAGIRSLIVTPLDLVQKPSARLRRGLEKPVLNRYRKKGPEKSLKIYTA